MRSKATSRSQMACRWPAGSQDRPTTADSKLQEVVGCCSSAAIAPSHCSGGLLRPAEQVLGRQFKCYLPALVLLHIALVDAVGPAHALVGCQDPCNQT